VCLCSIPPVCSTDYVTCRPPGSLHPSCSLVYVYGLSQPVVCDWLSPAGPLAPSTPAAREATASQLYSNIYKVRSLEIKTRGAYLVGFQGSGGMLVACWVQKPGLPEMASFSIRLLQRSYDGILCKVSRGVGRGRSGLRWCTR
jgi:hypothetical protein